MDFSEAQNSIDIKENYIMCLDDRLLRVLLKDKSTGNNIIWATDMYLWRGLEFAPKESMDVKSITGRRGNVIKPRIEKSQKEQKERIKKKGEVFTPSWICNQMASGFDGWFERDNVFNTPKGVTWEKSDENISFPEGKSWQDYIRLRVLEITCGEAPFLTSRYDTVTGKWIDVNNRIGLLDRKLRVVSENVSGEDAWVKYAFEAYQSTYGYEWQGDSLLIARENLLFTFIDFFVDKFGVFPRKEYLLSLANILAWNIFQMDGLKYVVPYSCEGQTLGQMTVFDVGEQIACQGCMGGDNSKHVGIYCKVKNWRAKTTFDFYRITTGEINMKFDFIIGNPPYQETLQNTSDGQVYNFFMDAAYLISDKVMLITPAKFLHNAGKTPKKWNEKMLSDKHLKLIQVFTSSNEVFPNTTISGGVAITYRDASQQYTPIGFYSIDEKVISIKNKVVSKDFESLNKILFLQNKFNLDEVYSDYPELRNKIGSDGRERRLVSSIFDTLPELFSDKCPNDMFVKIWAKNRVCKYINKKYLEQHDNLFKYKIILSAADGASGNLGVNPARLIGKIMLAAPNEGYTQTFISIGNFDSNDENICLSLYLQCKFTRFMVGILKATNGLKQETWRYVPMQDFTSSSDIDWSQSVAEIDAQLYKKYGLDDSEIAFIESHVKEMK